MHKNLLSLFKSRRFQGWKQGKKIQLILSPSPQSTSELDLGTFLQTQQKIPNSTAPPNCDKKVHVYTDFHKILLKVEFCFKVWEMLQLIKEKVSRIFLL